MFWILITGSRWCDLPKGPIWGSRSATHRWLGEWQENGTLNNLLFALKESAHLAGMIKWDRLAVDGFFSGGKGGGELVDYGYKGKGVTTHLLVDGEGNPLSFEVTSTKGDERQQVEKLIDPHLDKLKRLYDLHQVIPILEADKGYDSEELRDKLLKRKIYHSYLDAG